MDPGGPAAKSEARRSASSGQVHGDSGKEVSSSASSVLINPKDPHAVQLRQLGDEDGEQGDGVHHEMSPVVFGVEAG